MESDVTFRWLITGCLIAGCTFSTSAGTQAWIDPTGGQFSDAGNWMTGVPARADVAMFDVAGVYIVQFDANVNNTEVNVRRGDVTFDLGGFTYALSTATGDHIRIGSTPGETVFLRVVHGTLTDRGVRIGVGAQSTTMTLSGSDAQLIVSGNINAGYTTSGTLLIENGAAVTDASGFVGLTVDGAATVTGAGSTWNNTTFLNIGGPGGAFTAPLIIVNGGLVTSPSTDILTSGRLFGDGTIQSAVNNRGGIVAPGGALHTAKLTIDGSYSQDAANATASAALAIEIGGPMPVAGYDVLAVTGTVALSRSFNVSLINGFLPPPGWTFDVLTAASVQGSFTFPNLPSLPSGSFTIQYQADRVRLIAPGRLGDATHDGTVNIDDLVNVITSWGTCPTQNCAGDVNGDGIINIDDLVLVITQWG